MSERISDDQLAALLRAVECSSETPALVGRALYELAERRRVEREALGPVVRLPEGWEERAVPS